MLMTATLALRCREGVVLATDSRETMAAGARRIARDATKITQPRPGFLVGAAGFRSVTQAFVLAVQRADGLSSSRDRVEVQQRLRDLIEQIRAQGAPTSRSGSSRGGRARTTRRWRCSSSRAGAVSGSRTGA